MKWFSLLLLAAALIAFSAAAEEAEGAGETRIEKIITELDEDQFGADAIVERNERLEVISINGYPARGVSAALNIRSTTESFHYTIDFADYPFWRPATEYDGNLAVMSLTMALCANRALNLRHEPEKDFDPALNVERFFVDAGFTDIRRDDYSKETSMYTVSTAIGARRMRQEGEEPFTLIAVGVCGAFYKNEWQSNMTPGSGDAHEGFASAAQLVTDRIAGYIMTRGIKGRIKLWISGFSRAAAISNLVAGGLVRDGAFKKEDVYAYTFATPAAVLHPPETGYENIFNIISPMDLVPQVMPAEWGFGRYGRDLFLPLTEFSPIGKDAMRERREVAWSSFGINTAYSPALNLRMRLLFSMLLELLESREQYNGIFQPAVVGIMRRKNASNVLGTLRGVFLDLGGNSAYDRAALDRMLDYVFRVFGNVLTRTELADANTNTGNAGTRLFNEHREDTYLACIDIIHRNLFEDDKDFTYVLIRGPVRVRVTCPDDPGVYETLPDRDGVSYGDSDSDDQLLYMERLGNVSILALPHDENFRVEWEATGNGTVEVRQAGCSIFASARYPGAASPNLRVKAGDTGLAYERRDGETRLPEGFATVSFSAEELASFIGIASLGVNWRVALMGIVALQGIFVALLFCLAARLRRKEKPDAFSYLGLMLFSVSVLETEAAYWFLADQPALRALWKAVVGAVLIAVFFRRNKSEGSFADSVFPGLLAVVLADIVICFSFPAGVLVYLLAHILLIAFFQRRAPMRRARWAQWAVVSVAAFVLIVWRFVPARGLEAWMAAVYAPVLLLMSFSAEGQKVRLRRASWMFLASDLLLGVFVTFVGDPAVHAVYMLLFYMSMLLMASGKEKPIAVTGEGS